MDSEWPVGVDTEPSQSQIAGIGRRVEIGGSESETGLHPATLVLAGGADVPGAMRKLGWAASCNPPAW